MVTAVVLYLLMSSVARSDAGHEQRLQFALQGANASWWDWDIDADRIYYSRRWWEMLGYQPGELAGTTEMWLNLLHPDDRGWVGAYIRENAESSREQIELDFRLRHKDGRYRDNCRACLSRVSTASAFQDSALKIFDSSITAGRVCPRPANSLALPAPVEPQSERLAPGA